MHAVAISVEVSADTLLVQLADGRAIVVPLDWYPRLAAGATSERSHWQLLGSGQGIHWPDLDEDISVEALLNGQRSRESQTSLKNWIATRKPAH